MANDNHHHPIVEDWPDGVRFLPTDYQLITLFLNEREEDLYKLIPNNRIRDLDDVFSPPPPKIFHYLNQREKGVYNLLPNKGLDHVFSCSPPKIFHKYRLKTHENWFFYSKLKKHYSNRRRLVTGDGEGYWKKWSTINVSDRNANANANANGADQTIIGRRKDLRFYKYRGGGATAMKTNWIMHEYSSSSSTTTTNGPEPVGELDDVLLYMIYNTDLLDKPPDESPLFF